jgi:acetyltransferase-like isoleucine patch superfamily enzyme
MLLRELISWVQLFITQMPEESWIAAKLRKHYWTRKLRVIGHGPYIAKGAEFFGTKMIDIGNQFIMGRNVIIDANNSSGIYIGHNVGIALGSYIRAANHATKNLNKPIQTQGHESVKIQFNNTIYSIVINDDVWIGASAIILSGAQIGKGSIIAAGAVVSSIIPPFSIVVGNPGRVIANREKK